MYEANQLAGQFEAYVVVFDIVDFTQSCAGLFDQEEQGAVKLSRYLDKVFSTPVEVAERHGGFVSSYSGDACTLLFPCCNAADLWAAVSTIDHYFRNKSQIESLQVKVRLAVSYGFVQWKIYENDFQNEYVFFGEGIDEVIRVQKGKHDHALSKLAAEKIGIALFVEEGDVFLPKEDSINLPDRSAESYLDYRYKPASQSRFCHIRYRETRQGAGYRSAGFCFIRLKSPIPDQDPIVVQHINELADTYHGLVNKLEYSDKGFLAIVIFGIPIKGGNTARDMCNFALDLSRQTPEVAIGLTNGFVLACYTGGGDAKEYTTFGQHMNLAARLMEVAKKGEILTDDTLYDNMGTYFFFQSAGFTRCKGFKEPIRINILVHKLSYRDFFRSSDFFGREPELAEIVGRIKEKLEHPEGSNLVLYVSGDPGIGKSQLVKEAAKLSEIDNDAYLQLYVSCEEKNNRALSAIKQILGQIFRVKIWDDPIIRQNQFRGGWHDLAKNDPEMKRIESFIASLLNITWPDSEWSQVPKAQQQSLRHEAFVTLLKKLTWAYKTIMLFIDDGQWLDPESLSYLQALSAAGASPEIVISACRYIPGGTVDFSLENHDKIDIQLKALDKAAVRQIIQNLLRQSAEVPDDTIEFINSLAQGLPLFITHLTMDMVERGKIDENGYITSKDEYRSIMIIDDVIDMRIDNLSERLQQCLYRASVLGRRFPVEVLAKMLDTKLQTELREGETNRIWERFIQSTIPDPDHGIAPLEYIFSHILIQTVAYKRLLEDNKVIYHAEAAKAMEAVFDNKEVHAQEIANHYELAQVRDKAAEYYHLAGSFYLDQYIYTRAIFCLRKALELREQLNQFQDIARVLNDWARLLISQGDETSMIEASQKLERSLDTCSLIERIPGPLSAETYNVKANLMLKLSEYKEAEALFLKTLDIRQSAVPQDKALMAMVMHDLANCYYQCGQPEEAVSYFRQAIAIWEESTQGESPDLADSLNDLARVLADMDCNEEAEQYFQKAVRIREKTLGGRHVDLTESLNDYASFLAGHNRYIEAEPLFARALKIRKDILGDKHTLVADTLHALGVLYQKINEDTLAFAHLNQALQIRLEALNANSADLAESYHHIGIYHRDKTHYDEAKDMLINALRIRESVYEPDHPAIAETLNQLGNVYQLLGDNAAADICFIRATEIQTKSLNDKHSDYAGTLNDHAGLDMEQGNYPDAEKKLLSALEIRKKVGGEESMGVAETLNDLASLYLMQGIKLDEAEELLLRALAIRIEKHGNFHRLTSETMSYLGMLYIKKEDFDQAEHFMMRALAVRREGGDEDLNFLKSLNELADFLMKTGKHDRAITLLKEIIKSREEIQGKDHPDTLLTKVSLAQLTGKT
jgi:predicted ATPase